MLFFKLPGHKEIPDFFMRAPCPEPVISYFSKESDSFLSYLETKLRVP